MANLVGKLPPLEASGAAVTIVHPTATTVVGEWAVTWPDDMPDEDKPDLGPTRTFGYAHRLVNKPPRFARRHVRRDVQIEAREVNGWSNAEAQMDAAGRELSGDVVFQRTLTGDDLCGLVPNRDFKQGDVVPLLVWGMVVAATCTSIRRTSQDGVETVEAGFGPGLLVDRHGLDEEMLQIDRQMRSEAAGIHETLAKQLDAAKEASEQHTNEVVQRSERAISETISTVEQTAAENLSRESKRLGTAIQTTAQDTLSKASTAATSAANVAAQKSLEKSREELKAYRATVDKKIGAQGTLTRQLSDLNTEFTKKLGPKSDIAKAVSGQQQDAALLDAMIKGTSHRKLSGSQFQEHQQIVNQVQNAFNKRQGTINDNFTALFQAQAFTNDLQLAFNKEQVGINRTYDQMWLTQAILDLTQNYTIDYNRIMSKAHEPKPFTAFRDGEYPKVQGELNTFVGHYGTQGPTGGTRVTMWVPIRSGVRGFGACKVYWKDKGEYWGPTVSSMVIDKSFVYENTLVFEFRETVREVDRFEGCFIPFSTPPNYQIQLDRLTSEFKAEKKKLRDEYKRRWG